jgi:hypothetical protein
VLSLRFNKPGRYYLRRVRIDYTANGQEGWQYQNLYQTIIITLHNNKLASYRRRELDRQADRGMPGASSAERAAAPGSGGRAASCKSEAGACPPVIVSTAHRAMSGEVSPCSRPRHAGPA